MRGYCVTLLACAVAASVPAAAFERDVHFGLTRWLALQAGFSQQQADAIATGDQRVDSGDMQFIALGPAYACFSRDQESAELIERHHYPSEGRLPSAPEQRIVGAGSDVARRSALETVKATPGQAGYLLYRFGSGLHTVQDSWSHQGVPDVPRLFEGIACDANLAWAHPSSRGGWNSHQADLTYFWAADVYAMSKATYDLLLQYPLIDGTKRLAKDWNAIRPELDGFVRASTKMQKKTWFVAHGLEHVAFLDGTSLPDGAETFRDRWTGDKLPTLPTLQSRQHHADADLLAFYSDFFTRWAMTDDFDTLAAEFAVPADRSAHRVTPAMDKFEFAARLRAWRIRDHGRVANLAHSSKPLTAGQRSTLVALAKQPDALARYTTPADAYYPLVVAGTEPSPLLGDIVQAIEPSSNGNPRAVAMAKLRHAPYDTLAILAERIDNRWRIVTVAAMVDH